MKRLLLTVVILLPILLVGYATVALMGWGTEENRIWSELEELSKSTPGNIPFKDLDFVCFNYNNGIARQEFASEGRRLGQDFFGREPCGRGGSCCSFDSEIAGVIATVKQGTITCTQIRRLSFVLAEDRPMCVRPDSLIVKKRIFERAEPQPSRSWIAVPGTPYYEVREKNP